MEAIIRPLLTPSPLRCPRLRPHCLSGPMTVLLSRYTWHMGVFGEAGSPRSFPSALWDHLPREPEDTLRKQGGSRGHSLLPRTFPCSLLIILTCTCGLLLPQRKASIFSSKDVLQIFTKDGKTHCPQTVSVFYLEKLQRENTERPAVGLLDQEAREEYREKGTC